jgi:hypothetical protein
MATRSRTSFQKRQKEIARMERQRDKAARRQQRKLAPKEPDMDETSSTSPTGEPITEQITTPDQA